MKKSFALLCIWAAVATVSTFAAQPKLADNRRVISPALYDSPFFPPDPVPDDPTKNGNGCDVNGFCYPPASPPAPDCAYIGSCN